MYLSISGIYECQVSTTPPRSHLVHLDVAGKLTIFKIHFPNRTFLYTNKNEIAFY